MITPSAAPLPGLAPRTMRLVAAAADLLVTLPLLLLWVLAAAGSVGLSLGLLAGALRERPWLSQAGAVFAGTVAWVVLAGASAALGLLTLYQWYLLSTRGQTIGKRLVGIRIVDLQGRPAGFLSALVLRSLVFSVLISAVISFTSALVPFAGLAFFALDYLPMLGEDRRCVHDYFAGTQVRWVRVIEVYVGRIVAVAAGLTLAGATAAVVMNREAVLAVVEKKPVAVIAPVPAPTPIPTPAPVAAPVAEPTPPAAPAVEKQLYQFTDDQGVVHVTDELASVPEKFRPTLTSP